jgi:hypothetical protein
MLITLLIKIFIFFLSIFTKVYIFAEIKKQKTMYQVHIKEGINAEVRNCESLSMANSYVIEKASDMNLTYSYDADGWAFAHDEQGGPCCTEIYIFQII